MISRLLLAVALAFMAACSEMHDHPIPLSDADTIDDVGVLNDGGVDFVIACSAPLDDSEETLGLLALKVRSYARLATDPEFFTHYQAKPGPVRIFVSCEHAVSTRAKQLLDVLRNEIATSKTQLLLVKNMRTP